jgi:CRP-like cAMP-binding protein
MTSKHITVESYLVNIPLFKQLDSDEISRIAKGATEIDAPRGTVLFHRGDPCLGFHIVVFGQVKILLQSPQGGERVIELMGPGQSFGEAVMFLDKPYLVTTETLSDSKLLHFARETVFAEIDRDPRFARRMLAGLSYRLHHLIADIEMLTMKSGMQRVVGYLLSDISTGKNASKTEITLPAQKNIIASHLNLTQEHFSRILHELVVAGLIEVHGRDIHITSREKLRNFGS